MERGFSPDFYILIHFLALSIKRKIPRREISYLRKSFNLIGGIGGTLYHGLRTESAYLTMDWAPISILTLSAVIWFLNKLVKSKIWVLLIALSGFLVVRLTFVYFIRAGDLSPRNYYRISSNRSLCTNSNLYLP